MVSTIGEAEKDDSEACDNILKTNHVMSRNLVYLKFHSKDSKMLHNKNAKKKNTEKR